MRFRSVELSLGRKSVEETFLELHEGLTTALDAVLALHTLREVPADLEVGGNMLSGDPRNSGEGSGVIDNEAVLEVR